MAHVGIQAAGAVFRQCGEIYLLGSLNLGSGDKTSPRVDPMEKPWKSLGFEVWGNRFPEPGRIADGYWSHWWAVLLNVAEEIANVMRAAHERF